MTEPKVLIIGGGPTGLGAALRLTDLGHQNWKLIDQCDVGGLSRSYVDDHGFTWDLGGHVIFSHYAYFDDAMDFAVQDWNCLERESWVWISGAWVPYPFQNNIHRLPNDQKQDALNGLIDIYGKTYDAKAAHFGEYVTRQFGEGIANLFMRPYNFKVWAVPLEKMNTVWTGERVATVDLKRICSNIIHNKDDLGWGPNATFRFPKRGGTGGIWTSLAAKLPQDKFTVGSQHRVVSVDADQKVVVFADGSTESYDVLISTMPFDDLLRITTGEKCFGDAPKTLWPSIADQMVYSATHVIGLGIKGAPPPHLHTKCWMYFPMSDSPFYRCTVFSNYADTHAPEGHWSLMLEVSESVYKPVDSSTVVEECVKGCIASNLLTAEDVVVSKWHKRLAKGYPTPFVGRDELLEQVQPSLLKAQIYSRGRFGGWRYEVANQDHSMMQGVEAVDHALGKAPEEETYFHANKVNASKNMTLRLGLVGKQ